MSENREENNYREQIRVMCCELCTNVSENNTCIGTTYSCKIMDFEEVSATAICDKYNSSFNTRPTPQPESKSVEELRKQIHLTISNKLFELVYPVYDSGERKEHLAIPDNTESELTSELLDLLLSQTKRSDGATATTTEAERVVEALKICEKSIQTLRASGLTAMYVKQIKSTLEGRNECE
jgi:hypothetical protein